MKVIIAGGRDFKGNPDASDDLDWYHAHYGPITEVVSGGARGADAFGEKWAKAKSISVRRFPADWGHLGKRAGHVRNVAMAEYADALIAFPGGKGTANMIANAKLRGMPIWRPE